MKIVLFEIIVYVYMIFLYLYSPLVNIYLIFKKFKKNLFNFCIKQKELEIIIIGKDITNLFYYIRTLKYISDPKLFKGFTLNYIPFLFLFFKQRGSDCSGFARCIKKLLKNIPGTRNSKLWLITDKRFNLYNKILRSHIILSFEYKDFFFISDNKTFYSFKKPVNKKLIKQYIMKKKYVDNNEKEYQYKNPLVLRWF